MLEFLGVEKHHAYSESDLESAIVDKLERFLLELSKGFLFEARQKRFTFDDEHIGCARGFCPRSIWCRGGWVCFTILN